MEDFHYIGRQSDVGKTFITSEDKVLGEDFYNIGRQSDVGNTCITSEDNVMWRRLL